MFALGLDPHPASHIVVPLDRIGSLLGSITVPNTATGLEELHGFASQFAARRWAIEGAGNQFISQFVVELLVNGEVIYPIARLLKTYIAREIFNAMSHSSYLRPPTSA